MGCGASVEEQEEEPAEDDPYSDPPIARPRGGEIPVLPEGAEYGRFTVITPAGKSTNFGVVETHEMIAVIAPDGQELEVPCPAGYEGDGSSWPCLYVPDGVERPPPEYVGSGAGRHSNDASSSSSSKSRVPLKLCKDCGFGHKGRCCFKCGSVVPTHQRKIAPACKSCVYGTKAKDCAKCGEYMGPNIYEAVLCKDCAFGRDGTDNCQKCGAYCGAFYQ